MKDQQPMLPLRFFRKVFQKIQVKLKITTPKAAIVFHGDLGRKSIKAKDNHKRPELHRTNQNGSFLGEVILCKCSSKMSEIVQHQLSSELLREHLAY